MGGIWDNLDMNVNGKAYRTVWMDGGKVMLINQNLLPGTFTVVGMATHRDTATAIRDMIVRGAPAIGATGAFGLVQAVQAAAKGRRMVDAAFLRAVDSGCELLRRTRPTAQNLFYALDRVRSVVRGGMTARAACDKARHEADCIADEDVAACRSIGIHGAALLKDGMTVLTHCNAGWLATVDWGTALAPLYTAHRAGKRIRVFADETRPRCQGARLTAWELAQEGIEVTVIADNAAGHFLRHGEIDLCIVGADRIAANGDVANKVGTYEKAVLATENGVPFYVAAPRSTFDPACPTGDDIPIEERSQDEVLYAEGFDARGRKARVMLAPRGATARNPAFDVTPAAYIAGIITEHGIVKAGPGTMSRGRKRRS